jgi:hypothetical protein
VPGPRDGRHGWARRQHQPEPLPLTASPVHTRPNPLKRPASSPPRRHSLGGGLASLVAALLQSGTAPSLVNSTVAGVYTFGSPRVGDASWAQAYSALGLQNVTLRWVGGGVVRGPGVGCFARSFSRSGGSLEVSAGACRRRAGLLPCSAWFALMQSALPPTPTCPPQVCARQGRGTAGAPGQERVSCRRRCLRCCAAPVAAPAAAAGCPPALLACGSVAPAHTWRRLPACRPLPDSAALTWPPPIAPAATPTSTWGAWCTSPTDAPPTAPATPAAPTTTAPAPTQPSSSKCATTHSTRCVCVCFLGGGGWRRRCGERLAG